MDNIQLIYCKEDLYLKNCIRIKNIQLNFELKNSKFENYSKKL